MDVDELAGKVIEAIEGREAERLRNEVISSKPWQIAYSAAVVVAACALLWAFTTQLTFEIENASYTVVQAVDAFDVFPPPGQDFNMVEEKLRASEYYSFLAGMVATLLLIVGWAIFSVLVTFTQTSKEIKSNLSLLLGATCLVLTLAMFA